MFSSVHIANSQHAHTKVLHVFNKSTNCCEIQILGNFDVIQNLTSVSKLFVCQIFVYCKTLKPPPNKLYTTFLKSYVIPHILNREYGSTLRDCLCYC